MTYLRKLSSLCIFTFEYIYVVWSCMVLCNDALREIYVVWSCLIPEMISLVGTQFVKVLNFMHRFIGELRNMHH